MTIEQTVRWVIEHFEGALYTDDPVDTGGATKFGITLRTYDYWRRKYLGMTTPTTKAMVQALSIEMAIRIAIDVFALETRIAEITDWRVRLLVFDYAFHSGESRAVKALQHTLGVAVDGKLGPITLRAAAADMRADRTALAILTAREEFMQGLMIARPSQRKYMLGWWARTTKLQRVLVSGEA